MDGNKAGDVTTVLVGGAEGFLGRAAVAHFARRGKRVVGSCRTAADLEKMRAFVQSERLEAVTLLQADLADDAAVARLVSEGERAAGPLDGLFNAAGGFRYVATTEASVADFDFLISANLRSSWLLAKHAVPGMRQRGRGRLVFVSARPTLGLGEANLGLYAASKAALNHLVLGLAAELKKTGVTVNAVLPTVIDTPANRQAMPAADAQDWVTPEALLEVVAQLMGPAGTPLNGALVSVAGRL